MPFFDEALLMIGCSTSRSVLRFFLMKFSLSLQEYATQATDGGSLRWEKLSWPSRWLPDEQPPRPASAKPEARHVGCFLTAVGVPRFDPRPEGKGAGVQNAGMRASVGRRLHWAVSGLGLRGCCVGLAITEVTAISG